MINYVKGFNQFINENRFYNSLEDSTSIRSLRFKDEFKQISQEEQKELEILAEDLEEAGLFDKFKHDISNYSSIADLKSAMISALGRESEDSNNVDNQSVILEVLPKFWEDMGVKRPAYSGGDEAGKSFLDRDNTIELTIGDEPIPIYRRDARMYDDQGQKAGRDNDSKYYMLKLYKSNYQKSDKNTLKYSLDFQNEADARLGGNMNLKGIGVGDFKSDEVGSVDIMGYFKIVNIN
jgi:hypothetical protein